MAKKKKEETVIGHTLFKERFLALIEAITQGKAPEFWGAPPLIDLDRIDTHSRHGRACPGL